MNDLFGLTRLYDFKIYYHLYLLGVNSSKWDSFFLFFAKYGIVFFFLSFAYLIWNKKVRAFFCSFLAMGIAGLFDFAIFVLWKRPRPFLTYAHLVNPHIEGIQIDSASFPSSHTFIVFAIATSIFLYGHKKLGSALFLLALLTAIGRVGAGLHYPSDVVGGALLGIFSGIIAFVIVGKAQKNWD